MTKPEHWKLTRKNQSEPLTIGTRLGIFEIVGQAMSLGVGRRYRCRCDRCGQVVVITAQKLNRGATSQHPGCNPTQPEAAAAE
jgi:hypothetical protein